MTSESKDLIYPVQYITLTEFAAKHKVSRQAIHLAIKTKRLKAHRLGHFWLIEEEEEYVPQKINI